MQIFESETIETIKHTSSYTRKKMLSNTWAFWGYICFRTLHVSVYENFKAIDFGLNSFWLKGKRVNTVSAQQRQYVHFDLNFLQN